jgi:hypothetical protein
LQPRELFARSYAQFVASSSRDALMNQQLADVISAVEWQAYPAQWEEADFAPIMEALRHVFQDKGWWT